MGFSAAPVEIRIGTTALALGLVMYARTPLGKMAIDCPLEGTATTLRGWLSGVVCPSTVKGSVFDVFGPTRTCTGPLTAFEGTMTASAPGSAWAGVTGTPAATP